MSKEEQSDFERALKIAATQINSDGELIYHTLESAKQDEESGCFAISLEELYRFYLVVKGVEENDCFKNVVLHILKEFVEIKAELKKMKNCE